MRKNISVLSFAEKLEDDVEPVLFAYIDEIQQ